MRRLRAPLLAAFVGATVVAHFPPAAAQASDPFTLTSPAFADGGVMPKQYVVLPGSRPVSPPLAWSAAPSSTKQFALVMEDVSFTGFGPNRPLVHWVVYGVPGSAARLPEKMPAGSVTAGPLTGLLQGPTDLDVPARPGQVLGDRSLAINPTRSGFATLGSGPRVGFTPSRLGGEMVMSVPRPASVPRYRAPFHHAYEGPHRYAFTLYAVDADLPLPAGLGKTQLVQMIKDHIAGEATLAAIGPR